MKRCTIILLLLLLFCTVSSADAAKYDVSAGTSVTLKQRMATRSGPGTLYPDTGSYFEAGTSVSALSAAWDARNEIWWIQVEFQYRGKLRRAYTGIKRLNMDRSIVPDESVIGTGVLKKDVQARYGPGKEYDVYNDWVAEDTSVRIFAYENGYAQIEYVQDNEKPHRVWVDSSAL